MADVTQRRPAGFHRAGLFLRLLVGRAVHSAGTQDRDGASIVLQTVARRHPMLRHNLADGGHAGPRLREAVKQSGRWTVRIVERSAFAALRALPDAWAEPGDVAQAEGRVWRDGPVRRQAADAARG